MQLDDLVLDSDDGTVASDSLFPIISLSIVSLRGSRVSIWFLSQMPSFSPSASVNIDSEEDGDDCDSIVAYSLNDNVYRCSGDLLYRSSKVLVAP